MEIDWSKEILKLCAGLAFVGMAVFQMVVLVGMDWAHVGPGLPLLAGIMAGLGCFLLLSFLARIFSFSYS